MGSHIDYGVALYWLPLGAGGHSVRFNGRVHEALVAAFERRLSVEAAPSAAWSPEVRSGAAGSAGRVCSATRFAAGGRAPGWGAGIAVARRFPG
jgi:hypothetical protein